MKCWRSSPIAARSGGPTRADSVPCTPILLSPPQTLHGVHRASCPRRGDVDLSPRPNSVPLSQLCPRVHPGSSHTASTRRPCVHRTRTAALCTASLWKLGGIDDVSSLSFPFLFFLTVLQEKITPQPNVFRPLKGAGGRQCGAWRATEHFCSLTSRPDFTSQRARKKKRKKNPKKKKERKETERTHKASLLSAMRSWAAWCAPIHCHAAPSRAKPERIRSSAVPGLYGSALTHWVGTLGSSPSHHELGVSSLCPGH